MTLCSGFRDGYYRFSFEPVASAWPTPRCPACNADVVPAPEIPGLYDCTGCPARDLTVRQVVWDEE